MSWGDDLESGWNSATTVARASLSAVLTGARAVEDATAAVVQVLARTARSTYGAVTHAAVKAGTAVATAAVNVVDDAADVAATAGLAVAKATAMEAAATYDAAKQVFSSASIGVATVSCAATDVVAFTAATVLTKPGISNVLRPLLKLWGDDSQKQFDGDVLGGGCKKGNPTGVMPPGCVQKPSAPGKPGKLPKIIYVNGINTRYTPVNPSETNIFTEDGICKTMQAIAETTCSEVTGVYNATEGIGKDLDECLDNIAKDGNSPAIVPLRDMMVQAARSKPPQPITIFAHSQGGLITQQAVAQAKQQLMNEDNLTSDEAAQELGAVSVDSFGTAVIGWPKGPHYERVTNIADPVPAAILGTQTSFPGATFGDSASAENHVFISPHLKPIDSHSMDDTYLPEYGQWKGKHCACKGT
jgi:hypothetical protein